MNKKQIIIDSDGVILDYHSAFIDEYKSHHIDHNGVINELEDYFSPGIVNGLITLFNQTSKFGELEPYRDADVYLKKLHTEGYHINLITACGDGLLTQQLRIENLKSVFGDIFNDISFVGLGESKLDYLKKFSNTNTIYVDDMYHHYLDGESVGLDSVLMETEFNKGVDANRVNSWRELYAYIKARHKTQHRAY